MFLYNSFVTLQSQFKTQFETALTIYNFTLNCNKEQLKYVIDEGVIESLCVLLSYEKNEVVLLVLECLYTILDRFNPDIDALTDKIEECNGNISFLFIQIYIYIHTQVDPANVVLPCKSFLVTHNICNILYYPKLR